MNCHALQPSIFYMHDIKKKHQIYVYTRLRENKNRLIALGNVTVRHGTNDEKCNININHRI